MSCPTGCLLLNIANCSSPELTAGLQPLTEYRLMLWVPGSTKKYERTFTTDANGKLTIDKAILPHGFFAYGFIKVEIYMGNVLQEITVDGKTYSCVMVGVEKGNQEPEQVFTIDSETTEG